MSLADLFMRFKLILFLDGESFGGAALGLSQKLCCIFGRDFGFLLDFLDFLVYCCSSILNLGSSFYKQLLRILPHELLALTGEEFHIVIVVVLDLHPHSYQLNLIYAKSALAHSSPSIVHACFSH